MSDQEEIEESAAPLIEHLIELRRRLIWAIGGFFVAFVLSFSVARELFDLLVRPFHWAVDWSGIDQQVKLIYTAPQEFFFTQLKVAMFGGLILAFPLIANQIYKFVAPGLYKNERRAFLPFLIASPVLFLVGGALVYFYMMPIAMWFFLTMQQTGPDADVIIELLPKVSEYLSLIMTLIFAFGVVFQLPVVATLLARAGLATADGLAEKRKYAIVIAFIAAGVLTPPDPISQIGLAVPTILLYELSIWAARLVERQRASSASEDANSSAAAE